MKWLLSLLFSISILVAQPLHPLHPTPLTASLTTGYHRDFPIEKGFALRISADISARFALFPAQWGAAPAIGTSAEARYCFGKVAPRGFAVSAYVTQEFLFNPIFYEDERREIDPLWSLVPGVSLLWRHEPRTLFALEPYVNVQCRFYTSLSYEMGMQGAWGLDVGVRFSVSRKMLRGYQDRH